MTSYSTLCFFGFLIYSFFNFSPSISRAESFGDIEKIKSFLGTQEIVQNVDVIEVLGLQSHTLPTRPWSGGYWPDKDGSVAAPYERFGYTIPFSWWMHRPFIAKQLKKLKRGAFSSRRINDLSPAAKYDLLVGDPQFTFTQKVIERVDYLSDEDKTATWSGICHGWAPASLVLDRPLHSFQIRAANGMLLTFYPADVKALASILWANSFAQDYVKVEGWQCKSGARRDDNGRLTDPKCFDVNPGFFHLVIVNQLGIANRGVIIDRDFKKKIRNQPVYQYEYRYFNPVTRSFGGSLKESSVSLDPSAPDYIPDPYKEFRSPQAKSIVGIEMTARYIKEISLDHHWLEDERSDDIADITFRYDLELDQQGQIVGGEWRKYLDLNEPNLLEEIGYAHPDILWLVPDGLKAWSVADIDLGDRVLDETTFYSDEIRQLLIASSVKAANVTYKVDETHTRPNPQPIARIVDFLIMLSRK